MATLKDSKYFLHTGILIMRKLGWHAPDPGLKLHLAQFFFFLFSFKCNFY